MEFKSASKALGASQPIPEWGLIVLSGEGYLLSVLRAETQARDKRTQAERAKQARLPTYKGFEEFDTSFQKGVTREQLEALEKLEWLDPVK